MGRRSDTRGSDDTKRLLEAVAGGLGAVLALGTIAILVYEGATAGDGPPAVVVQPEDVYPVENGFVLKLTVTNRGAATAAEVQVEGTLASGGEVVETSETVFDYLPSQSRRKGGLFFTADPRDHEVAVRAKGYVDP